MSSSASGEVAARSPLALVRRRVYFAHQSVGDDIVNGVEVLSRERDLGLRFVQTRQPAALAGPAFVHIKVGRNQDPSSKNADFLNLLDARPQPDRALALLKYCYVDVGESTDVEAMFGEYLRMVVQVRTRHPDVTLVHATVPLTTVETPMRAFVKGVLGKPVARQIALRRHDYNELIRAEYTGRAPIFDVADIESLRSDGKRACFVADGATIPVLAAEYTYDGGHLNERGRRVVAALLLDVLARAALRGARGGAQ